MRTAAPTVEVDDTNGITEASVPASTSSTIAFCATKRRTPSLSGLISPAEFHI